MTRREHDAAEPRDTLPRAYWSRDVRALMAGLGTSERGLLPAEALLRLQRYGPNTLEEEPRRTGPRLLLRQFQSPLVLILLLGAVISLLLRSWLDAFIIFAIVLGSALLGFAQEYRASRAFSALRRRLALTARVRRDGSVGTLDARHIVPGDLVELSAGNLVPADGVIIEARDFLVNEASLTGESFPVEKVPGSVPENAPVAARTNCVYLGTSVRSGTATMLVVATARRTALHDIARRLKEREPETEFARGVRQFGYLLLRVMLITVVFVLTVNHVLDRPVIESLLFAVALAVGLSPELLPAIMSVTLSHGARAMASRGVLVRRLEAIEDLGGMDVLCTDKTGTLTAGAMVLHAAVDPFGRPSEKVSRLAHLNASLETGIDNPLDAAILAAGQRDGCSTAGCVKIDEIPYDFIRKRLTIVVEPPDDDRRHWIITKGAFDQVLAICSTSSNGEGERALDPAERELLGTFYREKGMQGFRVLAVAARRVAPRQRYSHADESGMRFEGFLLFVDPPKHEARQTIIDLAALGIRTKVITGDNRYVAAHIAGAVGLKPEAMLTGAEIARLKDEALWQLAVRTDLFVEVDPQQKQRIVQALQHRGHAVGYLGDGINDAPALHAADVGISVDQAVDVARESADVILLGADLDVLRRGVEEGRRTFANTLKYISITTSANFGNMVSMALATPLLPFLPLAAKQILLNNFLSDVPSIAISTDSVDAESLARPQRWNVREVQRYMLLFGLTSTVFDLVAFWVLLYGFKSDERSFQTGWFVLSLLTELAVVLSLRTSRPFWRSVPSLPLLVTTITVGALAAAIPYAPAFQFAFDFVPLPGGLFVLLVLIAIAYFMSTEAAKLYLGRVRARQA